MVSQRTPRISGYVNPHLEFSRDFAPIPRHWSRYEIRDGAIRAAEEAEPLTDPFRLFDDPRPGVTWTAPRREERTLLIDFARAADSDLAAVTFVSRRGCLGSPRDWVDLQGDAPKPRNRPYEPLWWIKAHARQIRQALAVRFLLEERPEGLEREIRPLFTAQSIAGHRFMAARVVGLEFVGMTLPSGTWDDSLEELAKHMARGQVSRWIAQEYLAVVVNQNLSGVRPVLLPPDAGVGRLRPEPAMAFESLRSLVYAQLMGVVRAQGPRLVKCGDAECNHVFPAFDARQRFCPPPPGVRSSLCGTRSRKRRYRDQRLRGTTSNGGIE